MPRQIRGRVTNVILMLGSFAVSLLVAEVALRVHEPMNARSSQDFRIPDPTYGWVLEPGASYVNGRADTVHSVTYNARGFRDVDHTLGKPDGRFRVLVLGDSFMEGYSVAHEDSFHRRLRARAAEAEWDIEVINLGVGGYGTLQEYLVLRDEGWLYEPDLVLLAFYASNDVRNNSLDLEPMQKHGGLKAHARPFLEPGGPEDWDVTQIDFEGIRRRFERSLAERTRFPQSLANHSALARLARRASESTERPWPLATEDRQERQRLRELADVGEYHCVEPPEFTVAWKTTERILARMKREADQRGVPLVVFSVPTDFEVSRAAAEAKLAELHLPADLCLDSPPSTRRLAEILERLGIAFVDLLEPFRRIGHDGGTPLFGRVDTHWIAPGHDLAAQHVLERLLARRELVPASVSSAPPAGSAKHSDPSAR